jgi:hypothetical protein
MAKGRSAGALFLATVAILLAASPAPAAPWTATQLPGPAGKVYLLGVSCPSKSLCVAVGTNNLIASSTDPTGGAGAWDVVYAGEGPWPKTDEWPAPFISGRQIQGVSCPSPRLCVGVTDQGNIYTSTQPTGPASSWKAISIDGQGRNTHLFGVSCPTVSLCVAVSGKRTDEGKILTSTDPTGDAAAWHAIELGESFEFRAVSCASPSLCVAVANDGRIIASTDPTGDASAWQDIGAPGGPGSLRAVSCVATVLCVSGNQGGNILSSANPAGGASSWDEVNGGGSVQITGVSCPSASECLVVDNNGDVLTSTDPTGGRGAWSFENLVPYTPASGPTELDGGNALLAASCPSNVFCATSGAYGQIFTSSTPFAKGGNPPAPNPARRRPKRPRARISRLHLPIRSGIHHGIGTVMVRFYAKGGARGFLCKLDRHAFKPCRSPKHYRLHVGPHVLRVRAIGMTGLEGPIARETFFLGPHCERVGHGERICQRRAGGRMGA